MERSKFTIVNMLSMHINNFFLYFIYFSYSLRTVYFLDCLYLGLLGVGTSLFPPLHTSVFEVKDAISAVINVDDYGDSARLLAATTLRNVLGTKNLGEILSDREAIANDMQVLGAENILLCGENI